MAWTWFIMAQTWFNLAYNKKHGVNFFQLHPPGVRAPPSGSEMSHVWRKLRSRNSSFSCSRAWSKTAKRLQQNLWMWTVTLVTYTPPVVILRGCRKSPFVMEETLYITIFNSYVKLPKGKHPRCLNMFEWSKIRESGFSSNPAHIQQVHVLPLLLAFTKRMMRGRIPESRKMGGHWSKTMGPYAPHTRPTHLGHSHGTARPQAFLCQRLFEPMMPEISWRSPDKLGSSKHDEIQHTVDLRDRIVMGAACVPRGGPLPVISCFLN